MSSHQSLPHRWPSSLQYLDALRYHDSVSAAVRSTINPGFRNRSKASSHPTRLPVVIRPILDTSHPAYGQCGLFAAKKIPPRTHILDYLGEVHCDDRPESDYDLSLYRSQDCISVAVDASQMGNEARFINDFRCIKSRPNAVLEHRRTEAGDLFMSVWSGSDVIKKGEEILISYGKGFWKARSSVSS